MIETVITIRNGKEQSHEQSIIAFAALKDVTIGLDDGELLITTTGTRKEHENFLLRLIKELHKEMR